MELDAEPANLRPLMERFESAQKTSPSGTEYWMGRDVAAILGYSEWRSFVGVIEKAIVACREDESDPAKHFVATSKMVPIGSGGKRAVEDYFLSRGACYLIAMNGNPRLDGVAAAQRYFAVQTRRMEKVDERDRDEERCELRDKATEAFKRLSETARDTGVRNHMQGVFHDAGYRGMYDMPRRDVIEAKGLKPGENLLNYAGNLELAAHLFRMELTDDVLARGGVRGETAAIRKHEVIGKEVRDTMQRSKGTLPEALEIEPHIREVRKRISGAKAVTKSD